MERFGELDHLQDLSERLERLLHDADSSDITFVVEGEHLPAHRLMLAASCDYFRALLLGGLRESNETEIVVKDAAPETFKLLLRYIYTGVLTLEHVNQDGIVELLVLSHKYGFKELQDSLCRFLAKNLSVKSVCVSYEAARVLGLKELGEVCDRFIDDNADAILESDDLLSLSAESLREIISRDSFFVDEMKIFEGVRRWSNEQTDVRNVSSVTAALRLELMKRPDLLGTVRSSELIPADLLLDVMLRRIESEDKDLRRRGLLLLEENVATIARGAELLTGETSGPTFLDSKTPPDDRDVAWHSITEPEGITIELRSPYRINHIVFNLDEEDSFSYHIDVSMSRKDWHRVIDHSEYCCRGLQTLFFEPRVCRYIRVVGVIEKEEFSIYCFAAMYTEKRMELIKGICAPEHNIATPGTGACVIQGSGSPRNKDPNEMINGDLTDYDEDFGYTQHRIGDDAIMVQLAQPNVIGSIQMLLWDEDDRECSYYIETSLDKKEWTRVVDHSRERCQSSQILTFEALPVSFIRIVGTFVSVGNSFRVVHFACPMQETCLGENLDTAE